MAGHREICNLIDVVKWYVTKMHDVIILINEFANDLMCCLNVAQSAIYTYLCFTPKYYSKLVNEHSHYHTAHSILFGIIIAIIKQANIL